MQQCRSGILPLSCTHGMPPSEERGKMPRLVRLRVHLVEEVEVLFRQTFSGL
jgi:hypothetical protein